MFQKSPLKRVTLSRTLTLITVGVFSTATILSLVLLVNPSRATAANTTNNTLNFQARLETAGGSIVPDGYYNVEFKIYDGDTPGGTAGAGAGFAGTNLWTETWYDSNGATAGNDNRVQVKNGYLTVSLGSQTAFPNTMKWDQGLWITLNVGGTTQTASPTWDGEMNPRLKLTGVPYAFRAGQLAQFNGTTGYTSILKILQPTVGDQTFQLPDMGAAGTYTICVQGSGCTGGGGGGGTSVSLQATTPGTPDTGNFNISGTGIAAILQAATFDTASAVSLNIGTSNATNINVGAVSSTATINIGQSTATNTINIGNATIAAGNTGTINIGTSSTSTGKTVIAIGSINDGSSLLLQAGTAGINIGSGGIANTIQIGNTTGAVAQTVNVGNNTTATANTTVTIGSLIDGSTTTIQGGTGGINLSTNNATLGVSVKTIANTTAAFLIQNSDAQPIFQADTTHPVTLINNGGFDAVVGGAGGWAATGSGASITRTTTASQTYSGGGALAITLGSGSGTGAQMQSSNIIGNSLAAGTYTISFYAKGGAAISGLAVSFSGGGTCTLNNTSVVTTGYQRYFCTVTTTGATTSINITATTTSQTLYIDSVQVQSGATATPYATGTLHVTGVIGSPMLIQNASDASSVFQIQNAASSNILFNADTINGRIGVGTASANYTLDVVGTINSSASVLTPLLDTASGVVLNVGTNNATGINLNKNVTVAAGQYVSLVGGITSTRPASPTEGMLYYDTTTKQLLTYANAKWQADRSVSTVIVGTSASGGTSSAVASKAPDGADFVNTSTTSAQTVINNAIAALPTSGGSVYLMDGTYVIDGSISLPNNTMLIGTGNGTIIKFKNGINANFKGIVNSDTSTGTAVTIQNLKIEGNKANQSGSVAMSGIYLSGIGGGSGSSVREGAKVSQVTTQNVYRAVASTAGGIVVASSAHTVVTNSISLLSSIGIYVDSSSNVTISNNIVRENTQGIYVATSPSTTVTGNTVQSTTAHGIDLETSHNSTVANNNVTAAGTFPAIQIHLTNSSSITGNSVQNSTGSGITVWDGSYNTVTSNVSSAPNEYGLSISVGNYNNFTGNTATGSLVGISLFTASSNVIASNKIHDNGGTTSNNGIVLSTTSTNNTITGNDITDTSCSVNCYAIDFDFNSANTGNYLSNNHIGSPGTINDLGVAVFYGNQMDGSGNLLNRSEGGGQSIGKSTAGTSLDVQGTVRTSALPTPTAPTLSTSGTAGSTTYGYRVSARDGWGETLATTQVTIATGNATLSSSNYINITWKSVGGATQYSIYRSSSAGTPATTGMIGTVSGNVLTFKDTGLAASGSVATSNTTGSAIFGGEYVNFGTSGTTTGNLQFYNASTANQVILSAGATSAAYALTLPTALGTTGDCVKLTGTAGINGTLGFGTCASSLQGAYDGSGTANPQILLSSTNGGIKIRDGSPAVSGNLFSIQNNAATATYLGLSSSTLTLQDSSGNDALIFDSTTSHLKIYENTTSPTRYTDIYYDNSNNEAVFAASSGSTRIGSGSGNVTINLTNTADTLTYTKSSSITGAYSSDDMTVRRTLTAGSNASTGSVLKVEDTSTGTAIASNIIVANQGNASPTGGNLFLGQLAGVTKFSVSTAGNINVSGTYSQNGSAGVSLSCGSNQVVNSFASAGGIVTGGTCGTAASTLQASYDNSTSPATITTSSSTKTLVFKAGATFDSATLFVIQNAASANLFVVDSSNNAIKIGGGDVSPNSTPTILVLDSSSSSADPSGVEGAMYYNDSLGKFRCYSTRGWDDCTSGLSTHDAISVRPNDTSFTGVGIAITASLPGAGTPSNNNQSDYPFTQVVTGTTAGNSAGYESPSGAFNILRRNYNPTCTFIVRTPGSANTGARVFVGLWASGPANTAQGGATNSALAFRYSVADGDTSWVAVTRDGTNGTVSGGLSGGTITNSTTYVLKVRVDASTQTPYFSVNGGAETSISTNLPSLTQNLGLGTEIITSNTTADTFNFGRAYCEFN